LAAAPWPLSKYLETATDDQQDTPAPIIILKISALPIMGSADNATLSGLIHKFDHDNLKIQLVFDT
jgi:hypothetical protein